MGRCAKSSVKGARRSRRGTWPGSEAERWPRCGQGVPPSRTSCGADGGRCTPIGQRTLSFARPRTHFCPLTVARFRPSPGVISQNAVSREWLNAYERGLGEQYSLRASDPHMGWDDSGTKALVGPQFVRARDVEFSCAASLTFVSWNGLARGSL